MSITMINDIRVTRKNAADLLGFFVDWPKSPSEHDTYCIDLGGWVLGRSSTVKRIEILSEGTVLQSAIIDQARPDVARAFPASPAAGNSGFRTQVNLVEAPPEFELTLLAVHDDGQRSPLCAVHGDRSRLGLGNGAMLQPLIVTTLGRTGSTWFMRLLGQHQSIVAYRPFEFEPRAGSYWVQVFKALADPKSYLQRLIATDPVERWWLGPETPRPPRHIPDPEVVKCLGGTGVISLAAFCQGQLDDLYRSIAAAGGLKGGKYFAEKYLPNPPFVRQMLWEWYSGAKEVVLVRDPRDIFCSIESFNAKRGYLAFARNRLTDEFEYIKMLIQQMHRLVRTWKARPSAVHLLRYEDLVREPTRTLTSVLQYLEIDASAEVVDAVLQRASIETAAMSQHRTSRSPADSIGRWRTDLSADLRALFATECGEILTQLAYD